MSNIQGLPLAVASLNLAGSLSSFLGSGFIIACYLILPMKRHFRHVLILNLATADCLNALNNSISGFFILARKRGLSAGSACIANGFLGQITVQATDCAILAIAIITVWTITRNRTLSPLNATWTWATIILVTGAIWILPIITSFIALGLDLYGPASGSWCWLVEKPIYIRYVLTHGWRFLFIFIEVGLYAYLHIYLRGHYRTLARVMESQNSTHELSNLSGSKTILNIKPSQSPSTSMLASSKKDMMDPSLHAGSTLPIQFEDKKIKTKWTHILSHRQRMETSTNGQAEKNHPRHKSIERILLLNAYPLAYIILWIPGIANRLIEASGHTSIVMQILQASTQFVGLANALTYGWNENIAGQLKRKYFSTT
ncbi:G protein-coupled glucose receptor regulating Gpa2-domain-containing protein [Crucibulum laeve]|uniref:G protein-coupled glucose receptor regulating Gpa2-domain-containing protein n=1 Tax=Crucibulum laeve TaxID=68775 RepID=A0A5C3LE60_9AGAR|nr:G protein-coupled glucose receptor regulating Gpa2-domain-containing protein [Crucibulum laeve]